MTAGKAQAQAAAAALALGQQLSADYHGGPSGTESVSGQLAVGAKPAGSGDRPGVRRLPVGAGEAHAAAPTDSRLRPAGGWWPRLSRCQVWSLGRLGWGGLAIVRGCTKPVDHTRNPR